MTKQKEQQNQQEQESNVENYYVVGKVYKSERAGHVVYVGFSEERQRHMFDLKYQGESPFNPFYEGNSMDDRPYGTLGAISEMLVL